MPRRNTIARFLCWFALLYVLLVLPWPGWERAYGTYFRVLARTFFAAKSGDRELTFETPGGTSHPWYTRIEIVNRRLMHEDGSGPVWDLDVDAIELGWRQTALLLALIAATPLSWRRRGWALLWGLVCLHAFILVFLGFSIWDESAKVALVPFTPFWKQIADGARDFMLWLYSAVIPVAIWILVMFRREDFATLGAAFFSPAKNKKEGDAPESPAEKPAAK